jgi:ectoine hydroxylase-related dioxygenase (phytanoyl-CoA dioxygenase family)
VVPADKVAAANADSRAFAIPARAGDIVLLHNHVWHRSGANRTDAPRRGFTVCYLDAATRCTRKKRAPRTFFPVFRDP